jgi:hypothetical protein
MSASWVDPEVPADAPGSSSHWSAGEKEPSTTDSSNWQQDASSSAVPKQEPKKRGRCLLWFKLALGIILTVLFVISASLEFNDTSRVIMWFLFYLFNAILAGVGVIRPFCLTQLLSKPILLVSGCMLVWAVVLVGLAASDLAKTKPGGSTEGGDADNRTYRQEVGFELGGAILGLLSAIYHVVMVMCCDKKGD